MKTGRIFLILIATSIATSCGIKATSSAIQGDPAYVKYSVYEEDHFGDILATSDCIVLDGSDSDQTTIIESGDFEDVELQWKLRHHEVMFKFEQDGDELMKSSYDTELFMNGYYNKQSITTRHGKTYLIVLSGPSC